MGHKTEFLYLSEPDLIKVGVLDEKRCVDVSEEVFKLLSEGDYLMGGPNHNSHGMGIIFPKAEDCKFPNMPVAGPDRRFFAMPAYLGGRFDCCGVKWYGSNAANPARGLPRSVLTVLLNDKDTGEPLAFLSANLISAMRTGAVPGVAARYLARKDSEVGVIVGCGPINKSCFRSIMPQVPSIKKVYCYDLFEDKAQATADWVKEEYGVEGVVATSLEEAVRAGDVITVAASRLKPLMFDSSWVKKGSTILFSGPGKGDEKFWTDAKIIYDHIGLHEAYVEEAIASGDKAGYYSGVIGGPIYTLIDEGKIQPLKESTSIGDVARGIKSGRDNDDQVIVFVACGMAVFDVAWSYDLYKKAQEMGVGQTLKIWDDPHWK